MSDALDPIRQDPDPDFQASNLGIDVRYFCERDPIGRYLLRRAEADRQAALEALGEVDPINTLAIRALQDRARVPQLVVRWLEEAISAGEAAETRIEDEVAAEVPPEFDTSYREDDLYVG